MTTSHARASVRHSGPPLVIRNGNPARLTLAAISGAPVPGEMPFLAAPLLHRRAALCTSSSKLPSRSELEGKMDACTGCTSRTFARVGEICLSGQAGRRGFEQIALLLF